MGVNLNITLKKRIVGLLSIVGIILIIIPLFFGRSVPPDELKLSGRIPPAPPKSTNVSVPIPDKDATVPEMTQETPAVLSSTTHAEVPPAVDQSAPSPEAEPSAAAPSEDSTVDAKTPDPTHSAVAEESHATADTANHHDTPSADPEHHAEQANTDTSHHEEKSATPATAQEPLSAKTSAANDTAPAVEPVVTPVAPVAVHTPAHPTASTAASAHHEAHSSHSAVAKAHHVTEPETALPVSKSPLKKTARPLPKGTEAWAVQVGTFGQKGNAERLTKKLQTKGFSAYMSTKGSATKVLVGPNLQRADAEQIKANLQKEFDLQGILVKAGNQ
jgi:DedD protein